MAGVLIYRQHRSEILRIGDLRNNTNRAIQMVSRCWQKCSAFSGIPRNESANEMSLKKCSVTLVCVFSHLYSGCQSNYFRIVFFNTSQDVRDERKHEDFECFSYFLLRCFILSFDSLKVSTSFIKDQHLLLFFLFSFYSQRRLFFLNPRN